MQQKYAIHPGQRPEFERHYNDMLAALAPVGAEESQLAEAIILDQFRMARARDLENEIFAKGVSDAEFPFFANAETWAKHAKDLAPLTLYSQRIHRVLIHNQADFAAKQAARKAAESDARTVHHTETAPAPTPNPQPPTPVSAPAPGFVRSAPQSAGGQRTPVSPIPDPQPPTPSFDVPIVPPSASVAA